MEHKESCTCGLCDGSQQNHIDVFCTEEEIIELQLIRTRIECANQAMKVQSIPEDVTEKEINMFVKAAIESKADAMMMESCWWSNILNKYDLVKLNKPVYVNFQTRELYTVTEKE